MKLITHLHLMRGTIPPLPQYIFMVYYLVKHRNNFTFNSTYCKKEYTVTVRKQDYGSKALNKLLKLNIQ
jgi:hypothetical protein